jgi:hypothetical protein
LLSNQEFIRLSYSGEVQSLHGLLLETPVFSDHPGAQYRGADSSEKAVSSTGSKARACYLWSLISDEWIYRPAIKKPGGCRVFLST